MKTWEDCRNYGLIKIQPDGSLRLYYDMYNFLLISNPDFMIVESAIWQGNHIFVTGRNQYDEPRAYIIKGLYESERVM